ncbi:ABC transporter permease [Nocardioides donggukensis]|uniref:ABC transporter permease n=1 Tax=Nocardioides donggukensis TaxID=2774019 RepID=A0A927K666_9ACTN|nr:ABC transporter permease [Nocardioides donggukensis]MBD8868435.1 ABC transporter permease [Nocardioides donggukensis]
MFRAALRSLLGRKLRLLMSTFAIVLGVGFVAGTLIFSDTLSRSFTAIFASSVGDVVVRPEGGPVGEGGPSTVTIPATLTQDLAAVEGAARADGNVEAFGVFVIDADGKPIGGAGPPALAGNWTDAPAGNGLTSLVITEGREPEGPGEVVLDAKTAEKSGYDLGDDVSLVTAFQQAELSPTLVGTADFGDGGSLNGATLAIFETGAAQDLFLGGQDAFNSYWVTAADGVSQEVLRDRVAEVLPEGVEAVTGDEAADESASQLLTAISFITTFLLIFAAISLVVGSFLIVNTFSILVAQRSRELALLRALGASRRQVRRMVLIEATVVGLVGSTLGLGLGVLLFLGIRAAFGQFGLDISGTAMVFEPRTVLAAYAVGVVVTVLAAWVPARRTSRIAPVAALRDDVALPEDTLHRRFLVGLALVAAGAVGIGLALFGSVPRAGYVLGGGTLAVLLGVAAASPVLARPFLAGTSSGYARGFGAVGTLAGQNSRRNPRRTAATASALMIGLTLCVTMAIVGSSAKASVDAAVEENFVGDFVVSNVFGVPFSPSVADRIEEDVAGVDSVTRLRFGPVEVDGEREGLLGTDPASLAETAQIEMVEGSLAELDASSVVIAEDVAEDRGVGVGDRLEVQAIGGDSTFTVAGIFAENPVLSFPLVVTLEAFADAGFQPSDNFLFVDVAAGSDREAARAAMEDIVAGNTLVSVKDQEGLAEEQRGPIDQLLTLIYGLLALALVIAVLGIVNTLALSVIERTREIGLLRAIGLSRRQLRTMIRLESVVIAVLGALLGTGLGLVFGVVLMKDLESEGLEVIAVPWGQLAAFLVVSLLVGVLAAVFPARRAGRLDVLRAIATE